MQNGKISLNNLDQNRISPVLARILTFPHGYSEVSYHAKKYGVQMAVFNGGKSYKLYAGELGGKNVISFNFYRAGNTEWLRPCEMSEKKVMDFLYNSIPLHG